ncbi:hypothetical protein SAMN05444274_105311 [Mariniphaga anaerophila]|uniref:Novel STAND NTPase 3 domain-containing protein n=1 Tax=Mariniphaga anaerophila TaxID=1484053 RepID=A0A1M5BUS9_9BACT|nr:hypothetical protein [Mariniphaga anaerophila]SHF46101.1 hypothetical protein SAMN05444274_105311 [Mariniphaga anaerophila]
MSRLQTIENALVSINETVFQELCDSFLILRNDNYKAFSRTGSQTGKQKTTKGTPDTFLQLPNKKYIFVEYSTNVTQGLPKLKEDIKKCIDVKKTGIPLTEIAEIIICINFNLKAKAIKDLETLLSKTRIRLTVYTLDALALELHLQHRNLVHDYLGLPLDTGQIVSVEKFITEYNKASKGIATPLNNPFLHRETELKDLKNLISKNDLIILYGSPGVGKTKLALETINDFVKESPTYTPFCISYKNAPLLEDLYQNLNTEKDYILFVDDANRIDSFNQIIGFYKAQRTGNLKILITVRDYAFYIVEMLCKDFYFVSYTINKFTDEQITDIVKEEPFGILNSQYHKEIIRIADGNPRIAIMTALLAREKQNIYALADVSDLFEKYYSTFIKDEGEFASTINIKTLGIIAFFYAIPYKDRETVQPILENFGIHYNTFFDCIEKLDRLELVEVQYEYVKISEQNISTYFFYKAFIKDSLLSFEVLFDKYFDNNSARFTDCVIPANNTFGYENVMGKLQPVLQKYWNTIKLDEERSLKLLSVFWFYLQNEALEFVYNIVETLPESTVSSYEVEYETNDFAFAQNKIIELLGEFFRFQNKLKDVIELSFEYTRKLPKHLPELIHKIKESLTFDWEDEQYGFSRQDTLFQILIKGLNNKDLLYSKVFFELSQTFLSFKYRQTKGGRNHSIMFYEYPIPNNAKIRNFRKAIWENTDKNFLNFPTGAFSLQQSYAQRSPDVIKDIMEYDTPFVVDLIEKYLTPDSFEHCRYVHEQIIWCKRNSVIHPDFDLLYSKFINPLYELFLKVNWDRLRDKESYDFDNHREYEKLKESEIRSSLIFNSVSELKSFYENFIFLKNAERESNRWNYNNVFDIIVDENCTRNFELGCQLLKETIANNVIDYVPRITFRNQLTTKEKADFVWNILQEKDFEGKSSWELSFYNNIADELINNKYTPAIKSSIIRLNQGNSIYFGGLHRFINVEPKLFEELLQIIVDRNAGEDKVYIWMDFFNDYFEHLGNDIDLIKKAYTQQVIMQNHFDYEKKGLLKILAKDNHFLVEYINALYLKESSKHYLDDNHELGIVWQIDNIEQPLEEVFDLTNKKEPYMGILKHFCNSFFWNIQGEAKIRAKLFLLDYCKRYYRDSDKINIVVDIVRHSLKEYYNDILLQFISITQDVELFSKIWWRGNGSGVVSGDVILGDLEASEWRNILSIIEKSSLGIKLIPIKQYINSRIESALKYADWERKRKFIERW